MFAYMPMGISRGRKLLANEHFDIINTHFALPTGPVGQALSRRFGIPNVLSVHGGDLYDPSKFTSPHRHWLLRTWVGSLARSAHAVVAQSKNTRQNLTDYFAPDVSASIIPLGISRPAPVSVDRAAFGFSAAEVVLVTVGRLIKRKRADQLVETLASLPESVRLLIIGNGPEESSLRAQADALGVAQRITFAGRVSDEEKFRLLAAADIFVSTSQHEGFGLVFLEAMAMGLPVVCYGNGGQTDYLVDGRSGHVVELNDVAAFAAHCGRLCNDASLRLQMADWNKRRVEDYFIDNCARQYEALFESIVARRSST
jgi:glycosyltransferase involved in cell wall biosynthesis